VYFVKGLANYIENITLTITILYKYKLKISQGYELNYKGWMKGLSLVQV